MDHRWAAAVTADPALFDGPVAALAGFERDGAGGLSVSWTRLTYRYRVLRGLFGRTGRCGAVRGGAPAL
ncbi:hypothetical protein [Streptomyces griseoluteus]